MILQHNAIINNQLGKIQKAKTKQNPSKCNFLYNMDSILLLPSISILFYFCYYSHTIQLYQLIRVIYQMTFELGPRFQVLDFCCQPLSYRENFIPSNSLSILFFLFVCFQFSIKISSLLGIFLMLPLEYYVHLACTKIILVPILHLLLNY